MYILDTLAIDIMLYSMAKINIWYNYNYDDILIIKGSLGI